MALNLIPNPPSALTASSNWTTFVAREDIAAIGGGINMRIFTLTNEGTTARPEVAQGSIIEVGGSWYQADSDTALVDDAGLVDGIVHIKLVPGTGTPDPTTVIPTLTSDAIPAWDAEKGGWYDVDDKFLPFEMTRSGAITKVYTNKCEWINQSKSVKICNDGSVGLDGNLTVGGTGSIGSGLTIGGALSGVTSLSMGGTLSGVTSLSMSGDLGAVNNLTVNGEHLPRVSTTNAVISVPGGSTTLLPRGVYITVSATGIIVEVLGSGGVWFGQSAAPPWAIFSDGANVRLRNPSGSPVNYNYRKF